MKFTYNRTNSAALILAAIMLVLTALPTAGCKTEAKQQRQEKPAKPVEVIGIEKGDMPIKVGFTGNLYSNNEVSIVPREGGQVYEIYADEGDMVTEGQVLLKINDDKLLAQKQAREAELDTLQNQYQQAQLNYSLQDSSVSVGINQADQAVLQAQSASDQRKLQMDQAKVDLDRQERLFEKGAVSKQSLENAQLAYDTAVKQYETSVSMVKNANESLLMAQANMLQKDISSQAIESVQGQINALKANIALLDISISDCEVKAPFTGVITYRDKTIARSSMVSANAAAPVFKMVDNSSLYMEGEVSEGKMSAVKQGCPVTLTMDAYPGKTFEGSVETIVPSVDSKSMSFTVRAVVPNYSNELKNGMFGRAEIEIERPEGLIVPYSCMIKTPVILGTPEKAVEGTLQPLNELDTSEVFTLYVLKDGKASKRDVIVKTANQDFALVTGGVTKNDEITENDKVITTSIKTLQDKEKVRVVEKKKAEDKGKGEAPAPAAPSAPPVTTESEGGQDAPAKAGK